MKTKRLFLSSVILLLLGMVLIPGIALGAKDANKIKLFVYIDGIPGGSTVPGYTDWIEAVAYGDSLIGTQQCAWFSPITIQKSPDKASPSIHRSAAIGQMIRSVQIHALKGSLVIWKVDLQNARISQVDSTFSDEGFNEVVYFEDFTRIKWTYILYDKKGTILDVFPGEYNRSTCQ